MKAQQIGAVLPTVLKRVERQREALTVAQRAWGRLVGKQLAAHTRPVSLRRGRLSVHVSRPGDSFMLSYQRPKLLTRLQAATHGAIEELVVRPGELSRPAP